MSHQTRRDFLGKALLAGAGAAFVRPEDVLATDDVSVVVPVDAPDPGFTAGQVVGVGKTSADFIVSDADKELRTLHTGPLSSLWKQGRWNSSGLEIGDCVYARGDALENGGLAIDRLWVDIKSFPGQVKKAGDSAVSTLLSSGDTIDARVSEVTEVEAESGAFVQGSADHLDSGDVVQVIGFGDWMTGHFTATRVLLLSFGEPTPAGNDEPTKRANRSAMAPLATCTDTFKGLTTWFCCGGVTGCGAGGRCPGDTSGGSCGGCRSDRFHMAWPKLDNGCGPFCSSSCGTCVPDLPRITCGKEVECTNPCNSNMARCTVKDCGPLVHCVSPRGCNNYSKVKFDLTPCPFSVLGNLDDGIASCHAKVTYSC